MSDSSFNLLHPGVQKAVWAMGWKEFHTIQSQTIREIIEESGHIILTAQTASGKTEAAFLPIISKIASDPQPSIQALYVGPLKALINDQFLRLEKLCNDLDIPVHRWHGDVTASKKKELRKSPRGILLITPESLESNFINFGLKVPQIYAHLKFVVIDELHSFLNNVRGIHLRSLLARLSQSARVYPRMVGLSATLGDPKIACRFLSPEDPDKVSLLSDPNASRQIDLCVRTYLSRAASSDVKILKPRLTTANALRLAERLSENDLMMSSPCRRENTPELSPVTCNGDSEPEGELDEIADDVMRHFLGTTNLVFVNSKKDIENLAVKLHERAAQHKLPMDPFVVHHGSISKELREEAEAQLKSKTPTTAICSSTLEMGIDIGSIKTVGHVDPPWSVAAMVQRLGRSGRREGEPSVMRMYVREVSPNFGSTVTDLLYPNLLRAIAMTRLVLQKWLEPPDTEQMHVSTCIHQILSCLKQTGGMTASSLFNTLVKAGPFRQINQNVFVAILKGLGEKKAIEQISQGTLILAPLGERIASSFDFYAAFKGTEEFLIRNGQDQIGSLPADAIPPVGEHLILAGRRWCVEEIDTVGKTAFVISAKGGRAPEFVTHSGQVHTRVLREMRQVLMEDEEPLFIDINSKMLLQAARTVGRSCGLFKKNLLISSRRVQWFPWIGTRGITTLKAFARSANIPWEADELSITYKVDSTQVFFDHVNEIIKATIPVKELASFMPVKAIQKFDGFAPDDILDLANGHDYFDLEEAKEAAQEALHD